MSEEQYTQIGRTKKPHGLNGELKLHIEEKYAEDFDQATVIFLEIGGNHTPFFVENLRGGLFDILKLEGVNSRSAAEPLAHKNMHLRDSDLLKEEERTYEPVGLEFEHLVGFQVHDETYGDIGAIKEIVEMPQQEMALVDYKGKEVMIPLNERLMVEVVDSQQVVKMDLPEGLLEL